MGRATVQERGEGVRSSALIPEAQESPGRQVTGSGPQTCQQAPSFVHLASPKLEAH